jgi:hypothetical protein
LKSNFFTKKYSYLIVTDANFRIAEKEAELLTPLRKELKLKRMELKSLKSKISLKQNMNLA